MALLWLLKVAALNDSFLKLSRTRLIACFEEAVLNVRVSLDFSGGMPQEGPLLVLLIGLDLGKRTETRVGESRTVHTVLCVQNVGVVLFG